MLYVLLIVWSMAGLIISCVLVIDGVHKLKVPLHKRIVTAMVCGPIVWVVAVVAIGYRRLLKWLRK